MTLSRAEQKFQQQLEQNQLANKESLESSSKDYGCVINDKLHDIKHSKFKIDRELGLCSPWIKSDTRFTSPSQINWDRFNFRGNST